MRAVAYLGSLLAGGHSEANQAVNRRRCGVMVLDPAPAAGPRPVVLDKHRRIPGGSLQLLSEGLAGGPVYALLFLLRGSRIFRVELAVLDASLRQWGQ